MTPTDSRERFSDRVADYIRYRPDYPDAAVSALLEAVPQQAVVADIGSGTGIFTRQLLARGLSVHGVEPNAAMRAAAETLLDDSPGFVSVDGQAENTGLAASSIDLITAAQAFHWFHNDDARDEFLRIMKPAGRLALIWNQRDQRDAFQQAYHALLKQHAPEYDQVNHMHIDDDDLAAFYRDEALQIRRFAHHQRLDLVGLLGRLKSASYCPPENSAQYRELETSLEDLLRRHGRDGELEFAYETRLCVGRLAR